MGLFDSTSSAEQVSTAISPNTPQTVSNPLANRPITISVAGATVSPKAKVGGISGGKATGGENKLLTTDVNVKADTYSTTYSSYVAPQVVVQTNSPDSSAQGPSGGTSSASPSGLSVTEWIIIAAIALVSFIYFRRF